MDKQVFAATGRRKAAVARVVLTKGDGSFTVNGKDVNDYLARETVVGMARQPLLATDLADKLKIEAKATGGGLSGQAGALRLAIARALVQLDPSLHKQMRKGGFLTRDAREVERKKYGQPKARKRFQYSKR